MTTAPDARRDEELARRLLANLTGPGRGVLPEGRVSVEAPAGALVGELLAEAGWDLDEPWTPLRRDLAEPVPAPDVRIEVVGADTAAEFAAVHRSAFDGSRFTAAHWHALAGGSPYADARSLLAYDGQGRAVAGVTVWSAGPGRPGLLEPMGVHRGHRRRGHGRAISVAAASTLRTLGSSTALVCTPSGDTAAVATYRSAGFRACAEVRDRVREAEVRDRIRR
ncbi:GNAT family N-acetyltransferase [Streptomyces sp. B-S-A6]|uniref:GNAT family N-acetyltransferase n=1 Tax=Streptomyces cavernicola TaxID=3043613 RepID=A0ABT6SD75_9ACTN|nr:GNAT family N-acetyltransferase [Streptomyces sp. B-S-A6]MDI3406145.1 GNAT family N-acetyltransferase [Streptomyces sp. B-S-A6]